MTKYIIIGLIILLGALFVWSVINVIKFVSANKTSKTTDEFIEEYTGKIRQMRLMGTVFFAVCLIGFLTMIQQ